MRGASQEPASIWDNIVSKRNTLLTFAYKGQRLSVWKHRNAQSEMDEYYVTPVPRLIPSSVECQQSILSDRPKLVFQVEMWSHAIQDAAIHAIQEHLRHQEQLRLQNERFRLQEEELRLREDLHRQEQLRLHKEELRLKEDLRLRPTTRQVHPLPFQKIRLVHRLGPGRADAAIQLDSSWLSNIQEKFQHEFFLWAEEPEVYATEKEKILANPESFANELLLEIFLTARAHTTKELSVQSHHITTCKLFARLNSMNTQENLRYLRSEDMNKMAQQIASKVIAKEISDEDYVPKADELSLKDVIIGQLKATKETTVAFTQDQWESVFWEPTFARPDKITDFLQNTVTHDEGSKKFKWDENKAKEWAEAHKTDLKKIMSLFKEQDSDVQKDISGSAVCKIPYTAGLFDISPSGSFKDAEKKKSSSKKESNDSSLEEGSEQGKDSVQLSEDEMNSWLRKNNMEVRVQGEMFRPKPMDVWRLNLRDLEQKEELLSESVHVHHVNIETTFQVGVKTVREEKDAAEEAEAMRKMLAETKEQIAGKKQYFTYFLCMTFPIFFAGIGIGHFGEKFLKVRWVEVIKSFLVQGEGG